MSTVETKRAEARQYQGVTYDPRIDKFTAEIRASGRRTYLGAFATAAEAGAVYIEQRRMAPITRRHNGLDPFHVAYSEFLATCEKDDRGGVAVGEIFTAPDGQRFRMLAVEHARKNNQHIAWSIWASRCRICGEIYTFSFDRSVQNVRWMVRNCKHHRGDRTSPVQSWPDPENWQLDDARARDRAERKSNREEAETQRQTDEDRYFPADWNDPDVKARRMHMLLWVRDHKRESQSLEDAKKEYEKASDGLAAAPPLKDKGRAEDLI